MGTHGACGVEEKSGVVAGEAPCSASGVISCDGGGELALQAKATQAQASFSAVRADFKKEQ